MARYLNLQVPSSCTENWNNMQPDQRGRHCFSCQKSVIDFTQMTDHELVNYFRSHHGSTCGRFTENQLNKDIPYPRKPLPWIKYFFQFSLPAFLLSLKSSGETRKLPIPMEITAVKSKGEVAGTVKDTLAASGYVSDDQGAPLAGATVVVKGTKKGTMTDVNGRFLFNEIDLPATLVISYVGFIPTEVTLSSPRQLTDIKLQLAPAFLGEVVIVGAIVPRKAKRKATKEVKTEKQLPAVAASYPNMLVYPNPVIAGSSLNLQCHSFDKGNYLAEWYNVSGQLVKTSKITYDKKNARISLPIDEMLPGNYFLQLSHEHGKLYSQQVVIRR